VQHDEAVEWTLRITDNFGRGYTDEQTTDITSEFEPLDGVSAERLYTQIKLLVKSSYKVCLKEIREAKASAGISVSGGNGSPKCQTVRWICQACSKLFNFNIDPAKDDEYLDVFNFCPHCGFIPCVTLFQEGPRITYTGDLKKIEMLSIRRDHIDASGQVQNYSWIDYYKNKKTKAFDKVRERESELRLFEEKGMLGKLAEAKRLTP
jgi:hypothetical protein